MKRICLLDLNYTLVSNQTETRLLRPFTRRMAAEEYRQDLLAAIKDDYVILITARPAYQEQQTLANIKHKCGWLPQEWYFNDLDAEPPQFKQSALQRFVFPRHGAEGGLYYAVESNHKTRSMYAKYGIAAQPYEVFMKSRLLQQAEQLSLFE